jgi:O-acetyl-ADP-ribose deacetylase (regulator of RNase III)
MSRIQQGDITQLVDAIVNAANEHLDGFKTAKELITDGK